MKSQPLKKLLSQVLSLSIAVSVFIGLTVPAFACLTTSNGATFGGSASPPHSTSASDDVFKPDTSDEAFSVTVTVQTSKTSEATISEESINEAIDTILTDAKTKSQANITLKVVDTNSSTPAFSLSISTMPLLKIAEAKIDTSLTVQTPLGSVTFNAKAVRAIAKYVDRVAIITIAEVDTSKLSVSQQSLIAGRPAVDVSITSKGNYLPLLNGKAMVSVPYTLGTNEDPDKLVGWDLDDSGKFREMDCNYNAAEKVVTFHVTHFSKYAIGYNTFSDVSANDWYSVSVKVMQEKGLINGLIEDKFAANQTTDRAMVVTMLHRLAGAPESTANTDYRDVSDGKYYAEAVKWAWEKGVVNGVSCNKFAPDQTISREQIVTILYRYAGAPTVTDSVLSKFIDAPSISPYAKDSFTWAIANGLIKGNNEGRLNPSEVATHAEVATIFANYLNNCK